MSLKKIPGLAILLILVMASSLLLAYSQVWTLPTSSAYVDQQWYKIVTAPDPYASDLLSHEFDIGGLRKEDIAPAWDHGFTITSMKRIGQMFTFENNRVWPTGIPYIYTNPPYGGYKDPAWVPYEENATLFRKALHRSINMDEIISLLYTDTASGIATHSKAEYWVPPGMKKWRASGPTAENPWIPDLPLPSWNPFEAADKFDEGGFVQHTPGLLDASDPGSPNPNYDASYPGSAEYLRVDPVKRLAWQPGDPYESVNLDPMEYTTLSSSESLTAFQTALKITDYFEKAGLQITLNPVDFIGLVIILVFPPLEAYQFATGVGIIWGSTAPDILRDFTYSTNIPLWNFVYMNYSTIDYWGNVMMRTLNETKVLQAAIAVQQVLADNEPYLPIILWNLIGAIAGDDDPLLPSYEGPGGIRIVNMEGIGLGNVGTRVRSDFNRTGPPKINKFGMGADLDTLNPLEADTAPDWAAVLGNIEEGLWGYTAFERKYWYWAALEEPIEELWIGPGSSKAFAGNGVYDAPVTYDPNNGTMLTYNGIPIEDVNQTYLNSIGDDVLGMRTTWKLRDDLYWHDSDPGPDGEFGTADDSPTFPGNATHGKTYPVNSSDFDFAAKLIMNKTAANYENVRYFTTWQFFAGYVEPNDGTFAVQIVNATTFRIYEERRYYFAFESHDFLGYAPKHIWEPFVNAGGDPAAWDGWTVEYDLDSLAWLGGLDPVRYRLGYSDMKLTHLIGYGPFVYHIGGWDVSGMSTHIEANPLYFGGKINKGDVDLETFYDPSLILGKRRYGIVDMADYGHIIDAIAESPLDGKKPYVDYDPTYTLSADLDWPAQEIDAITEVSVWQAHLGDMWGPGYP